MEPKKHELTVGEISPSDFVTKAELERYKNEIEKELHRQREKHAEDKEQILEKINETQLGSVRIEEAFKSIAESTKSIQTSVEKINDKVDAFDTKISDSNKHIIELDKKVVIMEHESIDKVEHEKKDDDKDDDKYSPHREKIVVALFTFLGIVIPALLDKADVLSALLLKLFGK